MKSTPRIYGHHIEQGARVLLNIGAILGLLSALVLIAAIVAGIRPVVFASGSMGPRIETGALAFTVPIDAKDIQPGQVISADRADGMRVTHRALDTQQIDGQWVLSMQGDRNSSPDADTYDVTDGAHRVVWHANGIGRLFVTTKIPLIGGAVALLLLAAVPAKKRGQKEPTETVDPQPEDHTLEVVR